MTNRDRINKMNNEEYAEFLWVCQTFSFLHDMIENHTINEWLDKQYNAYEFLKLGLNSSFSR